MAKRSNKEGTIGYVVRKNKKYWTGRVTVGFDDNGEQIRTSFSSYNKSEVQEWMRNTQTEIDRGVLVNLEHKTVSELYHLWLFTYKQPRVTPGTFSSYETKYRLYTKEKPIGKIRIKDLKSLHVQIHLNQLKEDGLSDNLIKNTFNQFKGFIEFLRDENIIKTNILNTVNLPKSKLLSETTTEAPKVFTFEEQAKILAYIKNSKDSIDKMIQFTFATGLRRSEVIALTWDDIIDGQVRVGKQYLIQAYISEDGTKKYVGEVTLPKSEAGIRYVDIPQSTQKMLEQHKVEQMKLKMLAGQYYNNNNLIFCDDLGNYLEKKRPNRRLQNICKELGLPHHTFHQIRHSYATRLFELNVPVKTVQILMGHEDISPTMKIYTHVSREIKQEAAAKLDAIL